MRARRWRRSSRARFSERRSNISSSAAGRRCRSCATAPGRDRQSLAPGQRVALRLPDDGVAVLPGRVNEHCAASWLRGVVAYLAGTSVARDRACRIAGRPPMTPTEVHGPAMCSRRHGVALAWGDPARRERGHDDGRDPRRRGSVRCRGLAVGRRRSVHAGTRAPVSRATAWRGTVDLRIPRAQFADFPRTELRFFASSSPAAGAAAAGRLSISAFPTRRRSSPTDAKLEAHLAARSQ